MVVHTSTLPMVRMIQQQVIAMVPAMVSPLILVLAVVVLLILMDLDLRQQREQQLLSTIQTQGVRLLLLLRHQWHFCRSMVEVLLMSLMMSM